MCHILDTLSFFFVDGLANCYKKSTNEEDLIIFLTPWVVLQATYVQAHRPHFLRSAYVCIFSLHMSENVMFSCVLQ